MSDRLQSDSPEVGHERSDGNVRTILTTAGVMVACGVVIHLVVWGAFDYFQAREDQVKKASLPFAKQESDLPVTKRLRNLPPPRLEGLERQPGQEARPEQLYAVEEKHLRSYGWVDREAGIVHIPIESAFRVIEKKKLLPARLAAAPTGKNR
jgi:hypothetical protein